MWYLAGLLMLTLVGQEYLVSGPFVEVVAHIAFMASVLIYMAMQVSRLMDHILPQNGLRFSLYRFFQLPPFESRDVLPQQYLLALDCVVHTNLNRFLSKFDK
jgi:hypothetical protein